MRTKIPAGALCLLVLAAGRPAAAVTPVAVEDRTVTATGTGEVRVAPDRAVLNLAVETRAPSAEEAARQAAERMQRVLAALERAGIPDDRVRTVRYDLRPERRPAPPEPGRAPEPRVVGYVALNVLEVTVDDLPALGSIIDAAIAAGANRVTDLSLTLKDPEEARLEALRRAVAAARAEARALADAAGQTLGLPLSLTTGGGPIPFRAGLAVEEARATMAAPTPIEAGPLTVTATVTGTWTLRDLARFP